MNNKQTNLFVLLSGIFLGIVLGVVICSLIGCASQPHQLCSVPSNAVEVVAEPLLLPLCILTYPIPSDIGTGSGRQWYGGYTIYGPDAGDVSFVYRN